MEFTLTEHSQITQEQLRTIAKIKAQHWHHSLDSQVEWMRKMYHKGDMHILLWEQDVAIGYVAVARITIHADEKSCNALGVSCLCVDQQYLGKGCGLLLMDRIREFAKEELQCVCLLCKEKLVRFYEKCGYSSLHPQTVLVEQEYFPHELMICDRLVYGDTALLTAANTIRIDRNF